MTRMATTLVHLSDIHFGKPNQTGVYDHDEHLRGMAENDLKQKREELGPMDGVLVTGDIAYSGSQDQYTTAKSWLQNICKIVGCEPERVWTVPGNHDVDRALVRKSKPLLDFHERLRHRANTVSITEIDKEIDSAMQDTTLSKATFDPLAKYNEFASPFKCQVSAERPYWEYDLILNDESTLRLRGVTSTLISNHLDNTGDNKLALGSMQLNMPRQSGIEFLILSHHPPQWLLDHDNVEQKLNALARIHLFGHKHAQQLYQINQSVRLVAGALHPDREEGNYQPRMNIIQLQVVRNGKRRNLEIKVYPRVWSAHDQAFLAEATTGNTAFRKFDLELPEWEPPAKQEIPKLMESTADSDREQLATAAPQQKGIAPMNPVRTLLYRFLNLPFQKQIEIGQKLGLLRDEDRGAKDSELFLALFRRGEKEEKLQTFWELVEVAHPSERSTENPFKKK